MNASKLLTKLDAALHLIGGEIMPGVRKVLVQHYGALSAAERGKFRHLVEVSAANVKNRFHPSHSRLGEVMREAVAKYGPPPKRQAKTEAEAA